MPTWENVHLDLFCTEPAIGQSRMCIPAHNKAFMDQVCSFSAQGLCSTEHSSWVLHSVYISVIIPCCPSEYIVMVAYCSLFAKVHEVVFVAI